MTTNNSFSRLSDAELLNKVKRLAAIEREATADLIRSLAEVEARRLHLASGCSSMFGYCTQVLHLSEHAAYARIAAARAATRFPVVMDLLIEGAITLTTVTLLGRHLTEENHIALLESARHKSKADVEMIVATLHPQRDVPALVRRMPAAKLPAAMTVPLIPDVPKPATMQTTTPEPASAPPLRLPCPEPVEGTVVRAVAPERYKLQVTIGAETRAKLRRAQDLLRHTNRSADEAAVIDRALTVLVEQLEKVKYGRTDRPRLPRAESRGPAPSEVEGACPERSRGGLPRAKSRGPRIPPHAMSPRICDARSADAIAIDARSSGRKAVALRQPGSNTTTAFHSPMAGRRPSTTSSCAARRTMPTKPSGGSALCSCGRLAARGACPSKRAARGWELGLDQVLAMRPSRRGEYWRRTLGLRMVSRSIANADVERLVNVLRFSGGG